MALRLMRNLFPVGGERMTTLGETLIEVWRQTLVEGRSSVDLAGESRPVTRTRSQGLKVVYLTFGDLSIEGIEQNPLKTSTWAKRASAGEKIMQFRLKGRYIGNVAEGKLLRYPAWQRLNLPE
jgi:hypothetical protein